MSITGPVEGPPCKAGVAVTDVLTGLYAATAVLACLHARGQSGHPYWGIGDQRAVSSTGRSRVTMIVCS